MINHGKVQPGSVLEFWFDSFVNTGGSGTISGFTTSNIKVYKSGSTTERASVSGFTLLDTDGINFDAITGINAFTINLADNSDANFYQSGARYAVVVSGITADSQTVSFLAGRFTIGEAGSILDTTISSLTTQTQFILVSGPSDDDALVGCLAIIRSPASAIQVAIAVVSAYTGASKTVYLAVDPGVFTVAASDNVSFIPDKAALGIPQAVPGVYDGLPGSTGGLPLLGVISGGQFTLAVNIQGDVIGRVLGNSVEDFVGPGAVAVANITQDSLMSHTDLASRLGDIAGSGFSTATDSLKLISQGVAAGSVLSASASTYAQAASNYALAAANRLGSFTGTGVNTVLGFLKAIMRSDATLPSDVGGTYDSTTDALEVQAGATVTSAEANKIADHILRRRWQTARDSADGDTFNAHSLLGATARHVNPWTIDEGTGNWLVYEEDGTTLVVSIPLTTTSSADQITGMTPP